MAPSRFTGTDVVPSRCVDFLLHPQLSLELLDPFRNLDPEISQTTFVKIYKIWRNFVFSEIAKTVLAQIENWNLFCLPFCAGARRRVHMAGEPGGVVNFGCILRRRAGTRSHGW